jgi:hypothetical protein
MGLTLFYIYQSFSVFTLLPIIYGLKIYDKFNREMRIFYIFLCITFLQLAVATYLAFQGKNTLWIVNLYTPIEVGFILWLYSLWQKNRMIQLALRISIIIFVCIWLGEIIVLKNIRDFTILSGPLDNFLVIIASAISLYDANKDSEIIITDNPQFWISSGLLLFNSSMLVILILSHTLLKYKPDILQNAMFVQPISSMFAQILFFGGFRCYYRTLKYGG